jgi:hypothetical protein
MLRLQEMYYEVYMILYNIVELGAIDVGNFVIFAYTDMDMRGHLSCILYLVYLIWI